MEILNYYDNNKIVVLRTNHLRVYKIYCVLRNWNGFGEESLNYIGYLKMHHIRQKYTFKQSMFVVSLPYQVHRQISDLLEEVNK